jgi:hypothetical protein
MLERKKINFHHKLTRHLLETKAVTARNSYGIGSKLLTAPRPGFAFTASMAFH